MIKDEQEKVLIPLTQGMFAIVDAEDYLALARFKWYAYKSPATWYARRSATKNGIRSTVSMHRVIAGVADGRNVDHRDGNGLNNTRANLRACTPTQNGGNRKVNSNSKTGFKGVSLKKKQRKYMAAITINKRGVFLGYFDVAGDAARAYDQKALEVFGEFARLNFPNETLTQVEVEIYG